MASSLSVESLRSIPAIYTHIARSRIRARVQYRTSFVFQCIGTFWFAFLDYAMILVIFRHLPVTGMAGWTFAEVSFLYGTSYITFRLADLAMTNLDRLPVLIRMGSFDQILTRPLGTLGQVLTGDLDVRHIGGMAQGGLVFAVALTRLSIDWTPQRVAVFVSMLVSAVVIFGAIWVATNAIVFWTIDGREVANAFTYGGNMLTQFPVTILGTWFRRIFAYLIPLAFVNYFPSLYVLGKDDGTPAVFRFLSPLAALACSLVAAAIWRTAVRRYRSTGS